MFEVDFHILNQKATPAIYADTLANIPAAGFAGRLFVNTASPYGVYRDTGSAWVQIASNGGGGGGSTGVNGLNGTTNIGLGGTLANNTLITGANFNLQFFGMLNFQSQSKNFTFRADSAINGISYISGGNDLLYLQQINNNTGVNSNLYFTSNTIKTIFTGANYGLNLDDTTGKFVLGDYDNDRKYNSIVVNDDTSEIYFTTSFNQSNTAQDLLYAYNTSAGSRGIKLGDFNFYAHGTCFIIDDANESIQSASQGSNKGISLDFAIEFYTLGDNNALIECDNINQFIELTANNIILNNTPQINNATLTNTATPTIPSNYLSIQINGNNYKILLLNP